MAERYTKKQREWVLNRDGHESQQRGYDESRGFHNDREDYCQTPEEPCPHLDINHIVPFTQAIEGGYTEDQANAPDLLITLAACMHRGICPSGKIKSSIALRRR